MAELGRRLRLTKEAGANLRPESELGREDLDGDLALEPAIAGEVHDAHAAAPDLAIQLVARAQYTLDVRAELGVCRRDDGVWHAWSLLGYDNRAVD